MSLNFHRLLLATIIFILPVGIREAILISLGLMFLAVFADFKLPKMKDFDESVCIEEWFSRKQKRTRNVRALLLG